MPGDGDKAAISPELASLDPGADRQQGAQPGGAPGADVPPGAGATDGDRNAAMAFGMMIAGALAEGVRRRWPEVVYTREEIESLAVVIAPVFVKYTMNAAWLLRYREEAALLGTLGMLAWSGVERVQAAAGRPRQEKDVSPGAQRQ